MGGASLGPFDQGDEPLGDRTSTAADEAHAHVTVDQLVHAAQKQRAVELEEEADLVGRAHAAECDQSSETSGSGLTVK